jgi:hypothetical protein
MNCHGRGTVDRVGRKRARRGRDRRSRLRSLRLRRGRRSDLLPFRLFRCGHKARGLAGRAGSEVDGCCASGREQADSRGERGLAGRDRERGQRRHGPSRRDRGRGLRRPLAADSYSGGHRCDRRQEHGSGRRVDAPDAGRVARAFDPVERLGVRRDENLEALVIRAPADGTLRHGRHIYRGGRTVAFAAGFFRVMCRASLLPCGPGWRWPSVPPALFVWKGLQGQVQTLSRRTSLN